MVGLIKRLFHFMSAGAPLRGYISRNIKNAPLKKISGIFRHRTLIPSDPLLRGFDEVFTAPHSRYSYVAREDIEKNEKLKLLAVSDEAGVYLAASKNFRQVYVTGHPEYDAETLKLEYERDINKGLNPDKR